MDDPRAADGVEHLQAAARELLLAARSFLDVVEEVVEDRDRLTSAATGVVGLLRDGLSGVTAPTSPLEPWERVAWQGDTADPAEADAPAGEAADTDPAAEPAVSDAAPRRRVRRIAVD